MGSGIKFKKENMTDKEKLEHRAVMWAWKNKMFILADADMSIVIHYYEENKLKSFLKAKSDAREVDSE